MRRGIAAGVAAALVFAAALVGGFGVLLQSALEAHGQLDRYAAAVAVVSGPQTVYLTVTSDGSQGTDSQPVLERDRVPVAEADELRTVPGVRSVVADFSIPVVTKTGSELTGHGWDSAALVPTTMASGQPPTSADEVVLDAASAAELGGTSGTGAAGVKVGDTVVLQAGGGEPRPYLVSGLQSGDGDAVYFSQAQAAALSGHPGSADALVVLGAPGTSTQALRAVAPGLVVATGAARGDVENPAVAASRVDVIATSASIGGVALLVVLLVVTGLLEMSVRDRTRELAVLRAVGATPRQVRRRIVRETLVIAAPAAAVGALLSLGLGALLYQVMTSQGVLPPGFALALGPLPVFGAALVTVLAAVGSAWLAGRRVSKIRPVQALGEAAVEPTRLPRWRVVFGAVCLALGLGSAVAALIIGGQPAAAASGGLVISLICATALLGPPIARLGIRVLSWPLRLLSPISGRLAAGSATAAAVRLAAVTTPIALALSFGATQLFADTTLTHATQVQADAGLKASQVLVGDGPGVPQQVYGAVSALPGTNGVTAVKRTTVVMSVTSQLESLQAEGIEGAFANLNPDVTSGSLADLDAPGTVALSTTVAGSATIGSTRSLWLGDGTEINPRVVAIYRSGQGFGDVLLPLAQVADHTTNGAYDDYLLIGGNADLQSVIEPYFGVHATSTALYSAALTEETRREGLVGLLAAGAIALFILIGVITTLAVATASRRRELALLRLIGATRGQVMRMLRLETVIILGTGTFVGALVAAVTLLTFGGAVTGLSALSTPPTLCAAILGTVVLAGGCAVLLPARSLLRRRQSPRIE